MNEAWRNQYDRWRLAAPPEPLLDEDCDDVRVVT